jgi:hypothetical protein
MPSAVVQQGQGERRPLVIAYHLAAEYLRGMHPSAAIWQFWGTPFSKQYSQAGAGVVFPLAELVERARREGFEPDPIVLMGWSEGCQGVRAHLQEGSAARDAIGGIVCLDGIHASTGFPAEHLEPWQWASDRAKRDALAFTWTTSEIPTYGYESTRAVASKVLGPVTSGTHDDGFFRLIATPGKGAAEHIKHATMAKSEGARVLELAAKRSSGGGLLGAIVGGVVGAVCGGVVEGKTGAAVGAVAGAAVGAIVGG